MSTCRIVREASTWGLSVLTAPAEVRRRSVAEGAAGVALHARLVRLHHAAIAAAGGAQHLEAGMRVAARGAGEGPGPPWRSATAASRAATRDSRSWATRSD